MVGNGNIVTAEELGDVRLQPNLELHDILFCPELRANLISVNKLIEDGFNVYFANNECSIWKGKTKIVSVPKLNQLLILQQAGARVCSALQLHRKMAHFGQMPKLKGAVTGLNEKDCEDVKNCEICIQAKQTRTTVEKRKEENAAKTSELLHLDLMGPITPCGRNGERFIITILDENSKLGFSRALHSKSDACDVVKNVIKIIERQTGHQVKAIRSDRGTEFINHVLKQFLAENGIVQQTSAPNTPQQNGNAERFKRTLIGKVRAVLLDS